jgi:alkylmercury lyase
MRDVLWGTDACSCYLNGIAVARPTCREIRKGKKVVNTHSLDTIAYRLTTQLDCTQDIVCRKILQTMAESGQPMAPVHLARRLQMSQADLATHLARVPDTEFDEQGNVVGWGITLLPTPHRFLLPERRLFTWCAFDTVLFPAMLQVKARVQSVCSETAHPITFVATPEGIEDLTPHTSVLTLVLPEQRCDCVRGTFCLQSLFFRSEQAASTFLTSHPEAISLSIEDAASVGRAVASMLPLLDA